MIRTTVRLEEQVFKEARKKAIEEGKPFAEVINSALRQYLRAEYKRGVAKKIKFGAYHLGAKSSLRRVDIYEGI